VNGTSSIHLLYSKLPQALCPLSGAPLHSIPILVSKILHQPFYLIQSQAGAEPQAISVAHCREEAPALHAQPTFKDKDKAMDSRFPVTSINSASLPVRLPIDAVLHWLTSLNNCPQPARKKASVFTNVMGLQTQELSDIDIWSRSKARGCT